MRFALMAMALNIALGAALFFALRAMDRPGFVGLAVATSAAAWVNVALMVRALAARGAYAPSARALGRLLRLVLASGAMGVVVWLAQTQRHTLEALLGGKELSVAAVVAAGGAAFVLFAFSFGAVRLSELRAAFRKERGQAPTVQGDLG
jgi:putative peptidoglycan lipid II flippase